MDRIKKEDNTNIDLVFLLYWGALVFWQNINPGSTGSSADTLIKTCLILFLVAYYVFHTSTFSVRALALVVILGANMAISFLAESAITLRNILTYFFPVVFVFLSLCTGGRFVITRRKLLRFMRMIIVIVLYMAVYAFFDAPEKFFGAFSINGAYGNELSSFLVSNLEYGVYLMAGITACIVCIELDREKGKLRMAFYTGTACIFFLNLILTYSRTAILATALIVISYTLLSVRSRFAKGMLVTYLLIALSILAIPQLRVFFFEIVFKGNDLAERDTLASLAVEVFRSGSWRDKLWGRGATSMADFFREETNHPSVHNGYLQILLFFGIVALCFLVIFLLISLISAWRFIKRDRFVGVISVGLLLACALAMVSSTICLFTSTIDSFFVTMFAVLVPQYVRNAICTGVFDE